MVNVITFSQVLLTWVLKQASEKPKRKLDVRAKALFGEMYPMLSVSLELLASLGKLINMKA